MKNMDDFLKTNLRPDYVPEDDLNQAILKKAKEIPSMKHKTMKSGVAAAAVIGVLALGSVTAIAAFRYLSPSHVANQLTESKSLADAFTTSNAVQVNESQISGGYKVTLLGMVSGANLIPNITDTNQISDLAQDQTYAVIAIEKEDGTPMPNVSDDAYQTFCVSPLIHGKSFMEVNNGNLNSLVRAYTEHGVQYELLECTNLEKFAHLGVSLGVVSRFGDESRAYELDENTGLYHRNTNFTGLNALFELPLERSKADPATANAFFESLKKEEAPAVSTDMNENEKKEEDVNSLLGLSLENWANLFEEAVDSSSDLWSKAIANSTELTEESQILTPDADGMIYYTELDGSKHGRCMKERAISVGVETYTGAHWSAEIDSGRVDTLTLNEDGTYTLRVYAPKQS